MIVPRNITGSSGSADNIPLMQSGEVIEPDLGLINLIYFIFVGVFIGSAIIGLKRKSKRQIE
jgi:hypothetical protein